MAVVISGPAPLALQIHEQLTLPLSAEAQIVQTSDYRRAAASIGIVRHPRSNRAAPWVGRALGVDLVLLIDGVKEWGPGGVQTFIGVRLLRSAGGPPVHDQRYFLPNGVLTPSIGAAMLEQLVPAIRQGAPQTPRRAADGAQSPPGSKPEPPTPLPAPGPPGPHATGRPRPKPQGAEGPRPYGRRFWLTGGPSAIWRRARLTDAATALPPVIYGAGHGLGRPLWGGSGAFGLYLGRLGVEGTLQLVAGKQSGVLGTHAEIGDVRQLHLQVVLASELLPHGPARVGLRAGLVYDRQAIDLGPFVGLTYLGPSAGAHFATPVWRQRLQLGGTLDGIFLGHMGLEARRAGVPHLASGVKAALTPRLQLGHWHLEATVGLDFRAGRFDGATALYSHVRYQALTLSDTHLHVGLALGGSL
jgi:hypothetical protein